MEMIKSLQDELDDLLKTNTLDELANAKSMAQKYFYIAREYKTKLRVNQLGHEKAIDNMDESYLRECYARKQLKSAVIESRKVLKLAESIGRKYTGKVKKKWFKKKIQMIKYRIWSITHD